jgi:LSD1 subclass zinc finger protein
MDKEFDMTEFDRGAKQVRCNLTFVCDTSTVTKSISSAYLLFYLDFTLTEFTIK